MPGDEMRRLIFSTIALALSLVQPARSEAAQDQNTQTFSYELRYASSDSSTNNRVRERYTHILRYSNNFTHRSKVFVYLLNSQLDARNPFGKSDADINGIGFGLTYQTGAFTTATIGFGINDNAEVFVNGFGPATSSGDAKTISFGMQRLIAYGPRSYLYGSFSHSVTALDQNFGGPFSDVRQVTNLSLLYGYKIGKATVLTASARSLFSSDRFSAHLVDQANYVGLGATHRIGDTTITLKARGGVGDVAGDTQVSLKIGHDF